MNTDFDFGEEFVDDSRYIFIDSKFVLDSDGTTTDYTMYYDTETDTYVFVFGDIELYSPQDEYFDWECETEEEAWEWFNAYEGPGSEDDEEYFDLSDWFDYN